MKLAQLKNHLASGGSPAFYMANGEALPAHFHVTELGEDRRHFIDCGGKVRTEYKANLQLWTSVDTDHRLVAERFAQIIKIAEEKLGLADHEITVEYQGQQTIERYSLILKGGQLTLKPLATACLAEELCGVPQVIAKPMINLANKVSSCSPGGGCC